MQSTVLTKHYCKKQQPSQQKSNLSPHTPLPPLISHIRHDALPFGIQFITILGKKGPLATFDFFDIIQVTTHFRLRLAFGFSPFLFDGIDAAVVVVVVVVIGGWEFVIIRNDSLLFDIVRFIVLRCVVGGCVIIIGRGGVVIRLVVVLLIIVIIVR